MPIIDVKATGKNIKDIIKSKGFKISDVQARCGFNTPQAISECTPDTVAPEGFRVNTIPARKWVVAECTGPMPDAIQQLWHELCAEFFPTSDYTPTYEMDIEAYPDGDTLSPDYKSQIWIPAVSE